MDDPRLKYIENSLTQLDKVTTWAFLAIMAIILSNNNSDEYVFGGIKIKKGQSAFVLYLILCGLNFQVLKLLQGLSSNFLTFKDRTEAISSIQNSVWMFNPFSNTTGLIGVITDNAGLPLLMILWFTGLALGHKEMLGLKERRLMLTAEIEVPAHRLALRRNIYLLWLTFALFLIYLIFGIANLWLIREVFVAMGCDKFISLFLFGLLPGAGIYLYYNGIRTVIKVLFIESWKGVLGKLDYFSSGDNKIEKQ